MTERVERRSVRGKVRSGVVMTQVATGSNGRELLKRQSEELMNDNHLTFKLQKHRVSDLSSGWSLSFVTLDTSFIRTEPWFPHL